MTDDLLTRRPHTPEEQEALQDRMSLLVGDVARASAVVELHLRQLMQALIDSKYAEVTAAGLGPTSSSKRVRPWSRSIGR